MTIEYAFEQKPDSGNLMEIADGLHWLRMPLPFILGHINLWLLRDNDGWTIVDTGLHDPATHSTWERIEADGFTPVRRVIVTHLHPDHSGCAGWLCRRHEVELWMPRAEYLLGRVLKMDTGREAPEPAVRFYRAAGYDEEQLASFTKRFGRFGMMVSEVPDSYRRIRHNEILRIGDHDWRVLVGSGHSPEHATLFCEELNCVISGDQILPTISSNVSVWPTEPAADPLGDWLDSLAAFKDWLPEDVLVLPAHGKPFYGAHGRLQELIDEHTEGLEKLLAMCTEPRRAVDVFPALFKSEIDNRNLIMATGESVAHLHYLERRGQLQSNVNNGVRWYHRT
ncbi:MAG: MBL fold metallo-hydrolase [Gammaproteobacteria bacterium]|nr:MBL fold metallo-hydrolase [Gammaproteobacteria bacterium]